MKNVQLLITNDPGSGRLPDLIKDFPSGEKLHILTLGFTGSTYQKRNALLLQESGIDYAIVDLASRFLLVQDQVRDFCLNFKYSFPRKPLHKGLNLLDLLENVGYNGWWFTGLSEMGSFRTPFVEDIYALALAMSVVDDGCGHVVLDILDESLEQVIINGLKSRHVTYSMTSQRIPGLKHKIKSSFYIIWLMQGGRFLFTQVLKYILFRILQIGRRLEVKKKTFLFFSFYPSLWSRKESGTYSNKIFSVVLPKFRKHLPGHDIVFITHLKPFLKNVVKDRGQLRAQGIIFLENYIELKHILGLVSPDYVRRILNYKMHVESKIDEYFHGISINPLVHKAMDESLIDPEYYRDVLVYHGIRNIVSKYNIGGIVHTTEFQCYEKAIWSATTGKTKSFGFQHSAIGKNWLNYFFKPAEIQDAFLSRNHKYSIPLPDKLITAGNYPHQVMHENGFPEDYTSKCGALRYDHLARYLKSIKPRVELRKEMGVGPDRKVILVLTGVNEDESFDMLESIFDALKNGDSKIDIYYKSHPLRILNSKITELHKANQIPQKLITLPVLTNYFDYLAIADAVIFCNSTIGIESVALGTPAISFDSYHSICSYDIIEVGNAVYHVNNADEIRNALDSIFEEDSLLLETKSLWPKAIEDTFYRLDSKSIDRFVEIIEEVMEVEL